MSLLLSCLDDFSTISSLKSIFWIVVFTSPCPCWTSASLAAAFFCTVLLLVLRLVSVAVLWFAFACCWLCSCACCWLCSSRFFPSSLQIFRVLLAVLVPVLLYFILVATGSWAMVLSRILTAPWLWFLLCFFLITGSLAVVLSVFFFWLVSGFPPKITTQHCAPS